MTPDDAGSIPLLGAGRAVSGPTARHRRTRMRQWRAWRHSRPFWGGLLMVLSGLELFALPLSGVLVHGGIKLVIYIGIGGVFGVLIGVLLIVSGLMTWFNATHKTFYSIAGIVLGIVSFPASNLGGLFLGMLLAIAGGSIAFAWTPLEDATEPIAATWTPDEGLPEQATLVWELDQEPTEQPEAPGEDRAPGRHGAAGEQLAAPGPAGRGPESGAALT
jgi:Family of unknown function (DUF6114)